MPTILDVAKRAARAAGERIVRCSGAAAFRKAPHELVTEADIEAQETLTAIIREAFPDHIVVGEEDKEHADASAANAWIVDPLDGTNNYAHGIPHYSVSVAYARDGRPRVGVVYDPNRDEMFWAEEGSPALLNGAPIEPSGVTALEEAIVVFGFYYDRSHLMRDTLRAVQRLLEANIRGLRRTGSAALDCCWVACGRFDAFFEYRLSVWDFAAGSLIARAAGARVTTHRGEPVVLKPDGIVAATPAIYHAFLRLARCDRDAAHA
jgi:myo-inositol-1(or 4)-monophosphatase